MNPGKPEALARQTELTGCPTNNDIFLHAISRTHKSHKLETLYLKSVWQEVNVHLPICFPFGKSFRQINEKCFLTHKISTIKFAMWHHVKSYVEAFLLILSTGE